MSLTKSFAVERVQLAAGIAFCMVCCSVVWPSVKGIGSPRSIVNLESTAAILFLAAIALSRNKASTPPQESNRIGFEILLLLTPLPFLITIGSPFLFDSYTHVVNASQESLSGVLRYFYEHPTGGDYFFRPIAYLAYYLEAKWAAFSFTRWHVDGIVLHCLATALVFLLGRRLSLSPGAATFAALIFGLHGANPEVVFWTAARFDELAIIFAVGSLVFLCHYLDNTLKLSGLSYALMILTCLCAVLSKEAGFCLPGLAICILVYRGPMHRRGILAFLGLTLTTLAALLYRSWVLGGVGGYRNAAGTATALQFNLLHLSELFSFRMWPVLIFPINWSTPNQWWLSAGIILLILGCVVAMTSATGLRKVIASMLFCLVALLPAAHLALLDFTLLGSRVYHLAVVGLALLFGAIYDGFINPRRATLTAACLLLFHSSALCHNLLIWRDTARLAASVCAAYPNEAAGASEEWVSHVDINHLPRTHNGVFFLANGFQDCILLNQPPK